uniref:Retrotransposon gag domain-containing protein n=1 Tax=Nelumbo nucifera TaxID=4432 RepID=A0A822XPU3_NELNU|nr:TPA_asm: hypothetical protein HUJ06_022208 [Nelumbo nucifera]
MANNEIRPIVQQQVAITARPEDTPSNPFYLHPNENPSLVLVSPVLSGPNFHSCLVLLMGAYLIPSKDDPTYPAYILWLDNTVDIWKDLHDRFSQGDAIRISELQEEIYNFRQNSLSVTDYHTQLKILWDEYVTLRPVLVCTCEPQCSCQALKDVKKAYQNDYSIRFLKGLNDNFATVRSQIFLMDPLPNINKLFSLVLQHERQFNNPVIKLEEPTSEPLIQEGPMLIQDPSQFVVIVTLQNIQLKLAIKSTDIQLATEEEKANLVQKLHMPIKFLITMN